MSRPVSSDAVVSAARAYLGTPFRHQGRTRTGLDCVGLVWAALNDAGLSVDQDTAYDRNPSWRRIRQAGNDRFIRLRKSETLRAGVIALFVDRMWAHVGIMTGQDTFIHSRGVEGVGGGVIEHRLDYPEWQPPGAMSASWGPRLIAAWRHPDMEWP